MRKKKKEKNFLNLIPAIISDCKWQENEQGFVQIQIPRDKLLDRLVRIFVKTPKWMNMDLDAYGSFLWRRMDGKRTVHQLAILLEDEFGETIKPLYERLGKYLNILKNNNFIEMRESDDE